jgi:hypothetical protein
MWDPSGGKSIHVWGPVSAAWVQAASPLARMQINSKNVFAHSCRILIVTPSLFVIFCGLDF